MPSDEDRLKALLGIDPKAAARPLPVWRRPFLWGWVVGVGVVCGVWVLAQSDNAAPATSGANAPSPSAKNAMAWWSHPTLGSSELPAEAQAPVASTPAPIPQTTLSSKAGLFQLDGSGQLVLDERTRLGVESLVALTAPEQMQSALENHLKGLPPEAAAAARELVGRYEGYIDAQKSAYSGEAPLIPEEGLAELVGLQALRVSYFGQENAQRMYGEEYAVSKRLLELMREDPVPDAPMEEKAVRAQARYDVEREAATGAGTAAR